MENLKLWNAVSVTNPDDTKHISQRGGFTSICAQSQIREATKQWGSIGSGWGVEWIILDNTPSSLCVVRVDLWYENRENVVSHAGAAAWGTDRIDADALKKAITDGTTKCLSMLGFNADVFLGKFDDNKYVQSVSQPSAEKQDIDKIIALINESDTDIDKLTGYISSTFKKESIDQLNKAEATIIINMLEQKKVASDAAAK